MRLSLCIATYNEEKNLHHALGSAIDLVDEVIVVDGSSSDKTVEVAKSYGPKVRVIVTDNPPIFHINKQKAIQAARGDWILQLDADEEISSELKEEISSVIRSQKSEVSSRLKTENRQLNTGDFVAFWLPRKNFFLGRFLTKGGQYPDYTIRLYKRGVAHFPCKTVHENVDVEGLVGHLKSPLLHFADPDFERYLTRWNRYTSLDAAFLVEQGARVGIFSYLFIKPLVWFLKTYVRHRGFMDGPQGFIFAFFSSIRFWAIWVKVWHLRLTTRKIHPL